MAPLALSGLGSTSTETGGGLLLRSTANIRQTAGPKPCDVSCGIVMKKWAWLGALGILGLAVLGFGLFRLVRSERQFQEDLQQARSAIAAARFGEARRLLGPHAARREDHPEVAYLLGLAEHAGGDPEAALESWSHVPIDSPSGPMVALMRAQVLVGDLGRFADAEPLLRSALAADGPTGVEARHALFQLLFFQGRTAEMRPLIRNAWSRLPDRAAELRDFWRIDNAQADLDTIRQAIAEAARRAPDDDRVWLAQAYLATLEGRLVEARQSLEKCLQKRPEDPAVWSAWLRWARAAGRVDEARRALDFLPSDRFNQAEILDLRAWFAAQDGDRQAERRWLEQLVALQPGQTQALSRLAILAAQSGEPDQAQTYRQQLSAMMQAKTRYRDLLESTKPLTDFPELARLAESLGHHFEALGWWTLAVEQQPADLSRRSALDRVRHLPAPEPPPEGQTLADLLGAESASPAEAASP